MLRHAIKGANDGFAQARDKGVNFASIRLILRQQNRRMYLNFFRPTFTCKFDTEPLANSLKGQIESLTIDSYCDGRYTINCYRVGIRIKGDQ